MFRGCVKLFLFFLLILPANTFGSVILYDSFTGTSGTPLGNACGVSHCANTGQPWYQYLGPTLYQGFILDGSGKAQNDQSYITGVNEAVVDSGAMSSVISAAIYNPNWYDGIVFRNIQSGWSGVTFGWAFAMWTSAGNIVLYKNGVVVASTSFTPNSGDIWSVSQDAKNNIVCEIGGKVIFIVNDSGDNANTYVGLINYPSGGNASLRWGPLTVDNCINTISTFAGTGVQGYNGDNIQATAAEINNPDTCIFDAAGNFYFCNFSSCRIRKIDTSGLITTIAGTGTCGTLGDGGQATAAQLYYPTGIAFDTSGNLWTCSSSQSEVRKITTSTGIIDSAFTGYHAGGLIFDGSNNLYFTDPTIHQVYKRTSGGTITLIAGTGVSGFSGDGGQATAAELNQPGYPILDSSGDLLWCCVPNDVVRKVNLSTGIISTYAGIGTSAGYSGDGGQATAAQLNHPNAIAMDCMGNTYISDSYNTYIRMVNSSGIITSFAGNGSATYSGDGGLALAAGLYQSDGLTFDTSGNLYISTTSNQRIRKVTGCNCIPTSTPTPATTSTATATTTATPTPTVPTATNTQTLTPTQTVTFTITITSTFTYTATYTYTATPVVKDNSGTMLLD